MADFFENIAPKVGVTIEQFKKLNSREALQLYVDSLQKANVSQKEMTFYMEAMASDSTALLPLLLDNGEAMAKLAGEADALGIAMTGVESEKIEALNQSLAQGKQSFEGMTRVLAAQFAPVIQGTITLFRDQIEAAGGMRVAVKNAYDMVIKGAGFVGNALRGIHVIIKSLEVGFHGFSVFINSVMLTVSETIDFVINGAKNKINDLISSMNSLPGIDLKPLEVSASETTQIMKGIVDTAKANFKEAGDEWHNLMMQPLPSETLTNWAAEVEAQAERAAIAANTARNELLGIGMEIPDAGEDPAIAHADAVASGVQNIWITKMGETAAWLDKNYESQLGK